MSNKQSSIDWLISGLLEYIHEGHHLEVLELYEQAKAMHKEENSETFNAGVQWVQYQRDLIQGGSEYWTKEPSYFPEYYNETFGSAE